MSWKATAYVKDLTKGITPSEKLLLFVMADYHNTAKSICWPSIPTLAREALMSERQASRILSVLEDKRVLRRVRSRGGHQTTLYQFVALDPEPQGGQNVIPENSRRDDIGKTSDVTPAASRDDIRDDKSIRAIRKNGVEPVKNLTGAVAPSNKGTRLTTEFMPTLSHCQLAEELGVDMANEFEKFRDHFAALPGHRGVKLDWDATFRNWLRNSVQYQSGERRTNGNSESKPRRTNTVQVERYNNNLAAFLRGRAAAAGRGAGVGSDTVSDGPGQTPRTSSGDDRVVLEGKVTRPRR